MEFFVLVWAPRSSQMIRAASGPVRDDLEELGRHLEKQGAAVCLYDAALRRVAWSIPFDIDGARLLRRATQMQDDICRVRNPLPRTSSGGINEERYGDFPSVPEAGPVGKTG